MGHEIGLMIEIKNIRKSFGDKTVIQDVSAIMQPGQCNLIIGTSGSGKTVLMKCMVGLLRPDSGRVQVRGQDLWAMNDAERREFRLRHFGFIFQGYNLFPALTARLTWRPAARNATLSSVTRKAPALGAPSCQAHVRRDQSAASRRITPARDNSGSRG